MKLRNGLAWAVALMVLSFNYSASAKDKEVPAGDKAKDVKETVTKEKSESDAPPARHAKKSADDKKAASDDEVDPKAVKLFGDWKLILSSLSDDQKVKMQKIHKTALAAKKEIDAKEETDLMEVLTPAQQKELEAAIEKEKADAKAERAAARAKDKEKAKE